MKLIKYFNKKDYIILGVAILVTAGVIGLLLHPKTTYPEVVHNRYSNCWAIKVSEDKYLGLDYENFHLHYIPSDMMIARPYFDTGSEVNLGDEVTFTDSLAAVKWSNHYIEMCHYRDSLVQRAKFVRDSLFKYFHTYN